MKPHPRIRQTIKWSGAALCVLLFIVWIGSGCFCVLCSPPGGGFTSYGAGVLSVSAASDGSWPELRGRWEFRCAMAPPRFNFLFYRNLSYWTMQTPLWMPFAASMLLVIVLRWVDALAFRRTKVGLCPTCSYSRAGLVPSAVCPECGSSPPNP